MNPEQNTWDLLRKCNKSLSQTSIAELIGADPQRFEHYSKQMDGLLVDFSRTRLDDKAREALLDLARNSGVEEGIQALFAAHKVNSTEGRPALHMALRDPANCVDDDGSWHTDIEKALETMTEITQSLGQGVLPGTSSSHIKHLIHVGIGGSLLGTRLLNEALPAQLESSPDVHFLGSVDACEREALLTRLNPEETAVVIVSKSFSTEDTLFHAQRLINWLQLGLNETEAAQRLFAVTASFDKALALGIPEDQVLPLWSWVGGRYSLWSAVSLAAATSMGMSAFKELLAGAAEMDKHFKTAPLEDNLPVWLALLGIWHRNIAGYETQGVIAYDCRLRSLPGWLQQLEMESNGKSVKTTGEAVTEATSPMIIGERGTDAQHSMFQAFHQGCTTVPLDLIGVIKPGHDDTEAHQHLLANMLAQSVALAYGRSDAALQSRDEELKDVSSHRVMPGNRPTTLILLDELSPRCLGRLLALYEHKVFVQSVIWGINPFDQWGVELGKELAAEIIPSLEQQTDSVQYGLHHLLDYIHKRK